MHTVAWWPTVCVLAMATFTDLRSRRIPNWLVFPFLVMGIGVAGWLHGSRGLVQSVAGIGLGTLIYGFLFLMGGMGAGDVKLCASVGAWIGPHQLFVAILLAGIVGGLIALIWSLSGGFLVDMSRGAGELLCFWKKRGHSHRKLTLDNPLARKMPYAPAIAIGTLLSFFSVPF